MPFLTLRQAETLTGKSRTALLKAIQRGRLSATKDDLRQWIIDPAELHRVYPDMSTPAQTPANDLGRSVTPPLDTLSPVHAERIRHLEDTITRLEDERDHLRRTVDSLSGLLTHQTPAPQAEPRPTRVPAWIWLVLAVLAAVSGALAALLGKTPPALAG